VLAAIIQNFKIEDIRLALQTFVPSPEFTPGRMNIFRFRNFEFMIDYAHNCGGFAELKTFLDKTKAAYKVGIITGVGDRRDEDLRKLGELAGCMFDEIIIRHDEDMRGRERDEMTRLLAEGVKNSNKQVPIEVISNTYEAVQHAMEHARKDAFIVLCTENVQESIDFVKNKLAEEKENYKTLDNLLSKNN